LRFTKVKKNPKKEIVSSTESKTNNDLQLEKFTQHETSFENAELIPQEINSASETEYFSTFSDDVSQDWLNWNIAWWRGMDPAGQKQTA
jgi:hypothetical protein